MDVVQTDLTTVVVSWATPAVTNSNITHFEVTLSADEAGAMERAAVVPATPAQTIYNTTFEGLTEFQRYSYQVRAFSEDGPGNYSSVETLTLGESPPHGVWPVEGTSTACGPPFACLALPKVH